MPACRGCKGFPGKGQVLEIGCGNGSFARRMAKCGAVDHVLATDFSQEQLQHARDRTPSSDYPTVQFAALDATRRSGSTLIYNILLFQMP